MVGRLVQAFRKGRTLISVVAHFLRSLGTRPKLGLLLASVLVSGMAIQVGADVFTVTNTDDDGSGSLRDAIVQANAAPGADEVVFDPVLSGQTILLTSDQLMITDDLVITGLGEDKLTVARDPGAPAFRIFEIDDGNGANSFNANISGLTISGGKVVSTEPAIPARGGGVRNKERLIMRDATVTGNRAESIVDGQWEDAHALGGGIESDNRLVLENTTISANTAFGRNDFPGNGSGQGTGGGVHAAGYLLVESSLIAANNAVGEDDWSGGAAGGGIYCEGAIIRNSTIANNTALGDAHYAGAAGGGILHSGELTILESVVSGNFSHANGCESTSMASGGGTSGSGMLRLRNSTVSGNRVEAEDCYFYATAKGGGVYCSEPAVIRNSTIALNSAAGSSSGYPYGVDRGGGADFPHGVLESTIIFGNTAREGPDLLSTGFTLVTNNLIGDPAGSSVPVGTNGNITGDPELGPLLDNGGPTETHALLFDSIAVGAGANPALLKTDQRGYRPREFGGTTDIGAFEYGAVEVLFADDFESISTGAWTRVMDPRVVTLPGGVTLEMARVPAGTFSMGAHGFERSADSDEHPRHEVTLPRDFFMGPVEVTQAQWQALMGSNPASSHGVGDDHPVYSVSWDQIAGAGGFIESLNQHLANTGQPGAGLFRLPTEAEWEYAARARSETRYSFGDALECSDYCQPCNTMGGHMWWCGNVSETMPVAGKNANLFGLWDMHGNVWEWVADWYGYYPVTSAVNPTGPATGSSRVVRGGGWNSDAGYARSASRGAHATTYLSAEVGFRLARDLE